MTDRRPLILMVEDDADTARLSESESTLLAAIFKHARTVEPRLHPVFAEDILDRLPVDGRLDAVDVQFGDLPDIGDDRRHLFVGEVREELDVLEQIGCSHGGDGIHLAVLWGDGGRSRPRGH